MAYNPQQTMLIVMQVQEALVRKNIQELLQKNNLPYNEDEIYQGLQEHIKENIQEKIDDTGMSYFKNTVIDSVISELYKYTKKINKVKVNV